MTDASLQQAIHEPVVLVPHDPAWLAQAAAERERLIARFGATLLDVQHIGSTAVAGLPAKPVIDLLAGVASMAVADALTDRLLRAGYTTSAAYNASLVDWRWFMRWHGGRRTHHLHVCVHGSRVWHARLALRDALRADADLAHTYATLKHDLATRFHDDREAYTQAKSDFIRRVVGSAY